MPSGIRPSGIRPSGIRPSGIRPNGGLPYSHVSRYSLDQKKVSSRSRLGHSRVLSRSCLGQFGKRLGLVSVSGAQVSVLVSVLTQKVLGPSLVTREDHRSYHAGIIGQKLQCIN